MEFYLGRNLAGHEFQLTDIGDIFEGEFDLYTQYSIIARLEDIFTNYPAIRMFNDDYSENNGYYDFEAIEELSDFLKIKFKIELTEEFLNYRLVKMMMDKLIE